MPAGKSTLLVPLLAAALLLSCAGEPPGELGERRSLLTGEERRARAASIRDAAEARGLTNGLLLGGIADAETGMAHCWSEATWACQGPTSPDCDGGPVIAGAGDGPCSLMQGGLGMFQFDAGTFDDTLAREGNRILTLAGNTEAAVDFVVAMVIRSVYVDAVDDEAQALAWMNEVRPWNALWAPWVQTVTHYYNGCVPGRCSVYETRLARYSDFGVGMLTEMGADFWYARPPACGPLPAEGGVLDETDPCFAADGPPSLWEERSGTGFGRSQLATATTDAAGPVNWAFFTLRFAEPGAYRIEVHTDGLSTGSTSAIYRVTHGGGSSEVPIDQTAVVGWQELGLFDFTGEAGERLALDDATGEPTADGRWLLVDAIRLTPEGAVGGGGVRVIPPGPDTPRPTYEDGGCAVTTGPGGGALPWLAVIALLLGRRRRRRRV